MGIREWYKQVVDKITEEIKGVMIDGKERRHYLSAIGWCVEEIFNRESGEEPTEAFTN